MIRQRDNARIVVRDHIMGMLQGSLTRPQPLTPSPMADVRVAASTLTGWTRRACEAAMALQYGAGPPLQAETLCGWSRRTVALGLAARRTGMRCRGAPSACRGRNRWEDAPPEAAEALRRLADAHAQPDPTCRTPLASTRLTATAALEALRTPGDGAAPRPAPSTLAEVLKRLGVRRRQVGQAQPHKTSAETAALFANMEKKTTKRCQRTTAHACASMVKPRCPSAMSHGAACPAGRSQRGSTTGAGTSRTCRVGLWRKRADSSTSPVAVLRRPVIAASRPSKPGGPPWMRVHRGPWRGSRSKGTMARKVAGGGRHVSGAWWRFARALASQGSGCTTRPITGNIIRSSGVGASWHGTGMAPSWWTSRRWWHGPRR
jgi:hypothetical protein